MIENCQDCVLWVGDGYGMEGICTESCDVVLKTGRFDSCDEFIPRSIITTEPNEEHS